MMDRRAALARLAVAAAAMPAFDGLKSADLLGLAERASRLLARGREYQPIGLDAHQFRTVTVISELIIPETDTPGATAAGVNRFIDLVVSEWFDADRRGGFLGGLAYLDGRSRATFNADFAEGTAAQQTALLEQLETEALALLENSEERAASLFFPTIKWLTLHGYYTSEPGATTEHHFTVIPGAYRGCEPAAEHVHG